MSTGALALCMIVFSVMIGLRVWHYMRLQVLIDKLVEVENRLFTIYAKYGPTTEALKIAGMYEKVKEIEEEGGRIYKQALKLTAPLLGWKLFGWIFKRGILRAIAESKYATARSESARRIYKEMVLGRVLRDKDFFHFSVDRLQGIRYALDEVKMFLFF